MKRAASIEAFVGDPVGSYHVGRTHLVWCASPSLAGSTHWGKLETDDALVLTGLFEMARHPSLRGGFDVFMDSAGIEIFGWPAFSTVSKYVARRLAEWGQVIRRQAVMVPRGPVGMLLAGMVPLLGPGMTYPMKFFSSLEDAFGFLSRPELTVILQEVQILVDEARGVSPVLRSLREHLRTDLDNNISIDQAASSLGLSPRTLQRELRRQQTQFSVERTRARVDVACHLLVHSSLKVDAIARKVGCASSSQLSVLFRRELGETPATYRERAKRAEP